MTRVNKATIALVTAFLACYAPRYARAGEGVYAGNTEAMGRAAVGHASDNSAITVNPGAIGLTERYDVFGHLSFGQAGAVEYGVSVMDARTSPVAFGLDWRRVSSEPELTTDSLPGWVDPDSVVSNKRRAHELTAALAYPLELEGGGVVSMGINGTLRLHNDDRQGKYTDGNMALGLGVRVDDRWSFGLAGSNLLPLTDQADELPALLVAGGRFQQEYAAAWSLDVGVQLEGADGLPVSIRTGGELLIGSARPRIGYRFEGPDGDVHWLTGGIGAENEAGSVEYALAMPVSDKVTLSSLRNTFSVRIVF